MVEAAAELGMSIRESDQEPIGEVKVVDITLGNRTTLYPEVRSIKDLQTPQIPLGRRLYLKNGRTATFAPNKIKLILPDQG